MLAGLIIAFTIFTTTGMAINCQAKGYNEAQCGESVRNERLVTDPRG